METQETQGQRALQKLKQNPGIPIGFAATCYALGMAFRRMQQRDSAGYQRWLRARVVAQGVTIVAIVYAGVKEWDKFSTKPAMAASAATEQRAFEERMKEAQEAHDAEALAKRPNSARNEPVEPSPSSKSSGATATQRTSWLSWLGISRPSSSDAEKHE